MSGRRRVWLGLVAALLLGAALAALLGPLVGGDPLEGRPAPEFSLALARGVGAEQGDRVRLADLRGKVVVLDFWASWCGPCKHSVPLLNRVSARFAKQVVVYGINSESIAPSWLTLVAGSWGFRYAILSDPELQTQVAYGVEALPTVVVIDREGIVRKIYHGEPTEAALTNKITSLID
jgi:cytochrome c biogenesis protein CcmG, thiol:disulfide interchange protein DsbE